MPNRNVHQIQPWKWSRVYISRPGECRRWRRRSADRDRSWCRGIGRLRQKINDDPKHPSLIRTVRNAGYIFASAVSAA
ncbi:MAG: winged helix-turn-helix domain-containing protein [Proteobacteria bacterium]|nr:winged helix-turn-helix domain-containing protein [Pseudomonadota bacterium]